MRALETGQAAFATALDHGPQHLLWAEFTGPPARILAGMKVHANTVSHARLVALEDTFPQTLTLIGHARFNECSRRYFEQPGVTALQSALVGALFPTFLHQQTEQSAAELARFEWLWLMAYHAADAAPLRLADLHGLAPDSLMDLAIAAHPAARLHHFDRAVDQAVYRLLEDAVPGLWSNAAVLLSRPEEQVLVSPASAEIAAIMGQLAQPQKLRNIFLALTEPADVKQYAWEDIMPALIALLEAGALMLADSDRRDR